MNRISTAAGGGKHVVVEPERLRGWIDRFTARHGGPARSGPGRHQVEITAGDGSTATMQVPFGPLEAADLDGFIDHVLRPRRIAVLLVRLGGHTVGVADGDRVVVSRTGRKPVHGRNSAGGWSQQRFARRREGQARQALQAAAQDAYEVLVPEVSTVDAVVLGGDRRALAVLRADKRLARIYQKAEPWILEVAEPRRAVLDQAVRLARSVRIVVRETRWHGSVN